MGFTSHLDNGYPGTSNDLESRTSPGDCMLLSQLLHNLEQIVSDLLATALLPACNKLFGYSEATVNTQLALDLRF